MRPAKGKRKGSEAPHYRLWDMTRGMAYEPSTPAGHTALEARDGGPFRPGKTARDWGGK
jgi:hypothetical protein